MNPTLIIDGDYFCYRSASASECEVDFSEDLTLVMGDFAEARRIFKQEMKNFRQRFDTDKLLITWTDSSNFRKSIDSDYKGNRRRRKPAGYLKLKQWAMSTWKSVMKPGLEADDVMGILATKGDIKNFVLVSPDKDMLQIPCRIYNLKEEFTQTPEAAERKLWEQCLTGDSTDGYGGAKGIGPKGAAKILDNCKDLDIWPTVVETYKKAGQSEEDALRNLRLARILQFEDWDADKQTPILIDPYERTPLPRD